MKKRSTEDTPRRLDKPLFEAGLQCSKRLYLDYHLPQAAPASDSRQAMSEAGQQLVELARGAFPRGVEVAGKDVDAAVAKTAALLAAGGTAVLFGAAFADADCVIVTDILLRQQSGELDVYEVKSGTKVKQRYLADLALQVATIERAGHKVRAAYVLHLDRNYQHKEGEPFDAAKLLKSADVTERVRRFLPRVADQIATFRQQLRDDSVLQLPTGSFCTFPFACPHLQRCAEKEPSHPLRLLPDLTRQLEETLHVEGIDDLANLDAKRPGLTFRQRRTLQAVQSGSLLVESFVREELEHVEHPLHFLALLDHTTALPQFTGQRPWQATQYGWAAETLHEGGRVESQVFVFADKGDPRPEFVRTLSKHLEIGGMVICWDCEALSGIRGLLDSLPTEKQAVRTILNRPHLDLARLLESGVFHPDLCSDRGLPAMARQFLADRAQQDLPIKDAEEAFTALQKAMTPRVRSATKEKIAGELKAWLQWRARTMQALHAHFGGIASAPQPTARRETKQRKQLPPS